MSSDELPANIGRSLCRHGWAARDGGSWMDGLGLGAACARGRDSARVAAAAGSCLILGALLGCASEAGVGAVPTDVDRGSLTSQVQGAPANGSAGTATTTRPSVTPTGQSEAAEDVIVSGDARLTGPLAAGEAATARRAIEDYVAASHPGAVVVDVHSVTVRAGLATAVARLARAEPSRIQVSLVRQASGWAVVSAAPLTEVK